MACMMSDKVFWYHGGGTEVPCLRCRALLLRDCSIVMRIRQFVMDVPRCLLRDICYELAEEVVLRTTVIPFRSVLNFEVAFRT